MRVFLSQISDKQITSTISDSDLAFLASNGYVVQMSQSDRETAEGEVSKLQQLNDEAQNEAAEEQSEEAALQTDTRKTHSFVFHFEGKDKQEVELQKVERDQDLVSKDRQVLSETEATIALLIQKKSTLDSAIQYNNGYLSLTSLGISTLSDLNVRNYRVASMEFPDYVQENVNITNELKSIAQKASYFVSNLRPKVDVPGESYGDHSSPTETEKDGGTAVAGAGSQLWAVGIGLAKLNLDPVQTLARFITCLDILQDYKSTLTNKLMAAEVIAAIDVNNDQSIADTLKNLDKQLRNKKVPKELSVGVAATLIAGKAYDGTYPLDRFFEFTKVTASFESAAILAIMKEPIDQISSKFHDFRELFASWGYTVSEDTELASAFLSISDLSPQDVEEKMKIIVDSLHNYLEYPLVAAAIAASIPTLEANETLDLMEKASSLLSSFATDLQHSELVALAIRMIHGIRNDIVKEIDPTARIAETPVQFTYATRGFLWFYPIIIAHHSYYSTFSGIGGFHPGHVHGVGGFAG